MKSFWNFPTYWENEGKYQDEYNRLYSELVEPYEEFNNIPTKKGKVLAAISNLYYEYFNNNNCNAVDYTTEPRNGFGDWEYDNNKPFRVWFITDWYKKMMNVIYNSLPESKELLNKIAKDICISQQGYNQNSYNYEKLIDLIIASPLFDYKHE